MASEKKTPPSVQYGSEEAVHAAVPGGRDTGHTADGDVAPEKSGREATGARDNFVSTDVTDRAGARGTPSNKTTS